MDEPEDRPPALPYGPFPCTREPPVPARATGPGTSGYEPLPTDWREWATMQAGLRVPSP